jgi:ankyrin repeat protein
MEITFDEVMVMLVSKPDEFRKVWGSNPSVREFRGLNNESLLHFLAVEGEIASVALLLELGAQINETNKFGDTALHDCVALGNVEMTELLLSKGADPNKANAQGNTSLHIAFESEVSEKMFQILVNAGGNLRLKNNYGITPEGM